jgi:hypothetical protein
LGGDEVRRPRIDSGVACEVRADTPIPERPDGAESMKRGPSGPQREHGPRGPKASGGQTSNRRARGPPGVDQTASRSCAASRLRRCRTALV